MVLCSMSKNSPQGSLIHSQLVFDILERDPCLPQLNGNPFFFCGEAFSAHVVLVCVPTLCRNFALSG